MKFRQVSKAQTVFYLSFLVSLSLSAIAPTAEEKEFLYKAKQSRVDGQEIASYVKNGWRVVEWFHKGVSLNNRVNKVLTDCWQRSYVRDDSSYSTKITEQNLLTIFEQFLIEMQPNVSYYDKQTALSRMRNDTYYFAREPQREFRPTVEKSQKLILRHLKDYIPRSLKQEFETGTDRVFKDGSRFLIYTILMKHNKQVTQDDVRFINAKMEMLLQEMGKQYPYVSVSLFESWAFSLLNDLMFSECVVCMDAKGERYMPCCKAKSLCRKCYQYVSSCPLCRAPK